MTSAMDVPNEQLIRLICSDVKEILPQCDEAQATKLAEHLVSNEIQSLANLKHVQEGDIKEFVGIFPARALVATWKKRGEPAAAGSSTGDSGAGPSGSSRNCIPLGQQLRHCQFQVNWARLDNKTRRLLSEKRRLKSSLVDEIIRIIVKDVKDTNPEVSRDFFKDLSLDIVAEYPDSFKDIRIDGGEERQRTKPPKVPLVTDAEKLCYKMKNRFDNTNRKDKPSRQKNNSNMPQASGCVQWSVDTLPLGESLESLQEKIGELKTIFQTQRRRDWNWDEIEEKMKITYCLQRRDLNSQLLSTNKRGKKRKRPTPASDKENEESDLLEEPEVLDELDSVVTSHEIAETYPFLFHPRGMNIHFQILTDSDFISDLISWLDVVKEDFVDFLVTKHEDNPKIRRKMKNALKEGCNENEAAIIAIILMLINYLKEDEATLVKFVRPGTDIDAVAEQHTIPGTPCMYAVGRDLFQTEKYYFSSDGEIRCSVKSFRSALTLVFCTYFVFNLMYPKELANTLDFIQRSIAEIDPKGKSRVPRNKRGPNTTAYALHLLSTQYESYRESLN